MKVQRSELPASEIRAKAEAWYASQLATIQACHGHDWPAHREWVESYLKQALRDRLVAIGWRPKT